MDIAPIMKKQRQTLTSLTVYVTGDQADEYPRYFKNIRIHYAIRGKDLKEVMVKKAIQLSD